jgi:AraC-like DNA-binding protein
MSKHRNGLPVKARRQMPAHPPSVVAMRSNHQSISNHQLAERLAGSALFRDFQRAFEAATALPLTLRAVESWQLAHTESRNQNGFCALMSQTNHSCAACLETQQSVCAGVNGVSSTRSCAFGLNESAVGVKIGQEIVAYLQTGQVFFKAPTLEQSERALKQMGIWGLALDKSEAARRYQATPVVRRQEYQARVQLLQFFADQLGALANQIVLLQIDAEPAQIAKARELIEAQYRENLSLAIISRQVGMSTFYFSKRFKQSTGTNYTDYVSRVRTEKAKTLLLNRNSRVSEIAYEVGFQSLTQFNRVFKRITGESPTEFRQQLQNS